MIDILKVAAIVFLMAVIATILRRRAGLIVVLWAFAIGFFIAARIAKMQVMKHLRETMTQTEIMQDALNSQMQREVERELLGSGLPQGNFLPQLPQPIPQVINPSTPDEFAEDEEIDDELSDELIDEVWSDE